MQTTNVSEELVDSILQFVYQESFTSTSDVAQAINISSASAYVALCILQKRGNISRGEGRRYNKQGKQISSNKIWTYEIG